MGLCYAAFEDHRLFKFPPRCDNSYAGLNVAEVAFAENRFRQMRQGSRPPRSSALTHNHRHMLLVQRVNLIHRVTERQERGDDRSRTRPENQVEPLAQWLSQHRFDLLEHAESVEALSAAAVQGKNS